MDFNRDYGNGSRFSDNSNTSNRSIFDGNVHGGIGNLMSTKSTEHLVFVRGMPFYCDEMDIYEVSSTLNLPHSVGKYFEHFFSHLQFFAPIKPIHCKVILNDKGRHSGKAEVHFDSREDVAHAMQKNREKMGSRYIELFDGNDSRRFRF